jgi:cytochrome c553
MRRKPGAIWSCIAAFLPLLAYGMSNARLELLEVLRSRPNQDRGAELFDTCSACHGSSGTGTHDGEVPRIAGQHVSVVAKQLVDYRHDRRWDLRMEHFTDQHHLADAQAIADVAAYINQLKIDSAPGIGTGELVERGASLYSQRCQSCHGRSGEGNAKRQIPLIAGQHYEYLVRQIHDAVDGRRPNFSVTHIRLLARLQRDDIVGLADYLSRAKLRSDLQPAVVSSRNRIDAVHATAR